MYTRMDSFEKARTYYFLSRNNQQTQGKPEALVTEMKRQWSAEAQPLLFLVNHMRGGKEETGTSVLFQFQVQQNIRLSYRDRVFFDLFSFFLKTFE